jgi:ferredoxin-NADP reductase
MSARRRHGERPPSVNGGSHNVARAAQPAKLTWQLGRVLELVEETAKTKSILLELPGWPGHRAGQHVDVRLTAPDGYQAQRSYSIASGPEDGDLVLTVERLEEGEVSPYLVDELRPGDELELRGPIGGYFVWEASNGGPLLLVAGGSGIVPFRSMLRHRSAAAIPLAVRLLYSSRSLSDVIYRDELRRYTAEDQVDVRLALTREWPEGWRGHRGRIDRQLLEQVAWPVAERPLVYVCGPSAFVESAAGWLVENGYEPTQIRTERFGPTGT